MLGNDGFWLSGFPLPDVPAIAPDTVDCDEADALGVAGAPS